MEEDGSRAGSRAAAAAAFRQNWLQSGFLLKAVISPRQPLSAVLGPRPGRGNARPWLSPQPPPYQTLCLATQNLTQPKEMGHALIAEVGLLVLSLLTDSPG